MDEAGAIQRMRRGDIAGLAFVVQRYQVEAVRAAYLITGERALAEDIVQAAFVRAYQRIHQFDTTRPFGPWFVKSVVNDALKAVRHPRALSLDNGADGGGALEDVLPDPAPSQSDALEAAEDREAVRRALGRLPPEQKAAIVMRYYLGYSEAEIADALRVPRGTVKWRLHAARDQLRALLSGLSPAPAAKRQD